MNSHHECGPNVLAGPPVQLAERLVLNRSVRGNLVTQIVDQVSALVVDGKLAPLERMPSVRALASALTVSSFSVVEAYDRLVTAGHLVSRRSSGYYVASRAPRAGAPAAPLRIDTERMTVASLLDPELFHVGAPGVVVPAGTAYLPSDWSDAKWLQECGRAALRSHASLQGGYSHRLGLPDLRRQVCRRLQQHGIEVEPDNVLLTRSAAHGLDLVMRALLKPGDAVVIEDPSYPGMRPLLDQLHLEVLPVPRTAAGLDMERFAALAEARRPKLAVVMSALHNPLGTTLSPHQAHQLLALAERHDFRIVEDDVFRDLAEPRDASLTALDGLQRVIRVDGTSKLLPSIARVGSVVAPQALIGELARLRMTTGLASSEFSEKIALHALSSSEFRRHVSRTKARLDNARDGTLAMLADVGMELLHAPVGGIFVCARLTHARRTGTEAARFALERGVVLSPSLRFSQSQGDAPWFRFHVAYGTHPRLRDVLAELQHGSP
ncbi:aminotransferase-like domain-containing protein [Pseudorhodoferax sp.]|uniref:aminotransferase-like domain-containing protein n=1 Tax=Pseudorhodoferax sp. TaxID=1993553 RepID=UPI002DD64EC5|nr:PLP-dependent aminotransferase family protein [Pseudorhodoferax sp.]